MTEGFTCFVVRPASCARRDTVWHCTRGNRANAAVAHSSSKSLGPVRALRGYGEQAVAEQPPRFYTEGTLPPDEGTILRLDAEEGKHATRVLRLKEGDVVEICDGEGGVAKAKLVLSTSTRSGAVSAQMLEPARRLPWSGPRWTVAAACGSLKGGRADWLVEKLSELGAFAFLPLLCERSPLIGRGDGSDDSAPSASRGDAGGRGGGGRGGRWERLAQAASKQCLRPHALRILPPLPVAQLALQLRGDGGGGDCALALLATAGAPPLPAALAAVGGSALAAGGTLIIGPEGDFTPLEKELLIKNGAIPIGLGPLRLRAETAAMVALSVAVLWPLEDTPLRRPTQNTNT